jgi:hypothetical protein
MPLVYSLRRSDVADDADLAYAVIGPYHDDFLAKKRKSPELWAKLSPGQLAIIAVWCTHTQTETNGFWGAIWNGYGFLLEEAAGGYRRIGAPGCAGLIDRMLSLFPEGQPPKSIRQRMPWERVGSEWDEPLRAIEEPYYELSGGAEPIETLMDEYIRAHPEEFFSDAA